MQCTILYKNHSDWTRHLRLNTQTIAEIEFLPSQCGCLAQQRHHSVQLRNSAKCEQNVCKVLSRFLNLSRSKTWKFKIFLWQRFSELFCLLMRIFNLSEITFNWILHMDGRNYLWIKYVNLLWKFNLLHSSTQITWLCFRDIHTWSRVPSICQHYGGGLQGGPGDQHSAPGHQGSDGDAVQLPWQDRGPPVVPHYAGRQHQHPVQGLLHQVPGRNLNKLDLAFNNVKPKDRYFVLD